LIHFLNKADWNPPARREPAGDGSRLRASAIPSFPAAGGSAGQSYIVCQKLFPL